MNASTKSRLADRLLAIGPTIHRFALKRERAILWWAVAGFVLTIGIIGAWKLWAFGYNSFDLAIYRQVATNSIHGHLFAFTIHPHSFLGDHLELFLLPVFAVFAVLPHPLTLVVLQAIALAIAVFPLAKISARVVGKPWHLAFALAYLANPVVQNMAVFEFHALPFAIPILSFALLAYLEKKFFRFLLLAVLALTVREDVSLAIIGFGLWALVERRSAHWSFAPIILGGMWLAIALAIAGHLNGSDHYKFLAYYGWLGSSAGTMLTAVLTHPWLVIRHVFSLENLKFLVVFLMPFGFLPLFRWRWLIPALLSLLQLLLLPITGVAITQIHYPAVLIPFFIAAMAAGWQRITDSRKIQMTLGGRAGVGSLMMVIVLYSMITLGPIVQAVPVIARSSDIADRVKVERHILQRLPAGGTVAGYETLTALANRPRLFSLHYVFLGHKQFSSAAYILPDDVSVVVLDLKDFLMYQLQYPDQLGGYARVRKVLAERGFVITTYTDRFLVYERTQRLGSPIELYRVGQPAYLSGQPPDHAGVSFLGWSTPSGALKSSKTYMDDAVETILPVSLTFKTTADTISIHPVEFAFSSSGKIIYREIVPLGGGIFPTSDWPLATPVTSSYRLLIPRQFVGRRLNVSVRVLDVAGDVMLNGVRSLSLHYTRYRAIGPTIPLGDFTP